MDLIELFKRAINQPTRIQPSFIIIGAQKAGTTALFKMLARHPDIRAPQEKEIHHFSADKRYALGFDHYLSQFPIRSIWRQWTTFEASPNYLRLASKAAPRIRSQLPEVICIAILRDPVTRAYSDWNMFRYFKDNAKFRHLHDPRTFRQAVEDELAGQTECWYHEYLSRGHYAEQIACFMEHFPKDQLIIRSYLDLKKDPEAFVDDLCKKLGLAPMPKAQKIGKVRANTRSYIEPLDPDLAAELYQYFAPELVKLRDTLGYDLDILESNSRETKK